MCKIKKHFFDCFFSETHILLFSHASFMSVIDEARKGGTTDKRLKVKRSINNRNKMTQQTPMSIKGAKVVKGRFVVSLSHPFHWICRHESPWILLHCFPQGQTFPCKKRTCCKHLRLQWHAGWFQLRETFILDKHDLVCQFIPFIHSFLTETMTTTTGELSPFIVSEEEGVDEQ